MSKRKLSRKQAWRAQKIQEERIKRAKNKQQKIEENASSLGNAINGRVIAGFGVRYLIEDENQQRVQCIARQNLGSIVVGDNIIWQSVDEHDGVISAVLPRKSLLERPNFHGNTKPVAANIDQILIVNSPIPALQTALIDRYLVAVEMTGIKPVIVINKIDLLSADQLQTMQSELQHYSEIGYELLFVTTKTRKGLHLLESVLSDKVSVLVGQSGVGKSSTIKALLPDIEIQIGEISASSQLGKHTTSAAHWYHLPYQGAIIDSPGVRDFGLWHIPKEKIDWGFVEFRPYLGRCKFSNCTHLNEPGCAIMDAKSNNKIPEQRWNNYKSIFNALAAR